MAPVLWTGSAEVWNEYDRPPNFCNVNDCAGSRPFRTSSCAIGLEDTANFNQPGIFVGYDPKRPIMMLPYGFGYQWFDVRENGSVREDRLEEEANLRNDITLHASAETKDTLKELAHLRQTS